ncbi:hypothetical protein ACV17F_005122 [Vibrio harveyi]
MKLNKAQKKAMLNLAYSETNPIKPHEAAVISSILKIHTGEHFWRFQKHVFCGGCRKELNVLDYFLSSLKHHSPEFILGEICPDFKIDGTCDHEADAITVDKVDIVKHESRITCMSCGYENKSEVGAYKLYVHPGCKGYVIRMGENKYKELSKKLP